MITGGANGWIMNYEFESLTILKPLKVAKNAIFAGLWTCKHSQGQTFLAVMVVSRDGLIPSNP